MRALTTNERPEESVAVITLSSGVMKPNHAQRVSATCYHFDNRCHKIRPCRNLASLAPSRRSRTRNIRNPQSLKPRKATAQNFVLLYSLAILTRSISMRGAAKGSRAGFRNSPQFVPPRAMTSFNGDHAPPRKRVSNHSVTHSWVAYLSRSRDKNRLRKPPEGCDPGSSPAGPGRSPKYVCLRSRSCDLPASILSLDHLGAHWTLFSMIQ